MRPWPKSSASLGAVVVRGGPGNNPSVAELVRAVDGAPGESVAILPNHPNVVPAAQRAAAESGKDVLIVPALSVPQGVAAAAAFNPSSDPRENADAMAEAARSCTWRTFCCWGRGIGSATSRWCIRSHAAWGRCSPQQRPCSFWASGPRLSRFLERR